MSPKAPIDLTAADVPQLNENLAELLDEQAARLGQRRRSANWVILAFFGVLMSSASAWYVKSDANRQKVANLINDIKTSGKDFKLIGSATGMASQYDKALEKIGTRKDDINKASVSMGIDSTKVTEDGMDEEMKTMQGGEGKTANERNRLLQKKLGPLAKSQVAMEKRKEAESAPQPHAATPQPAAAPQQVAVQVAVPVAHDEPLIIR